jgi:hypothetical protein
MEIRPEIVRRQRVFCELQTDEIAFWRITSTCERGSTEPKNLACCDVLDVSTHLVLFLRGLYGSAVQNFKNVPK